MACKPLLLRVFAALVCGSWTASFLAGCFESQTQVQARAQKSPSVARMLQQGSSKVCEVVQEQQQQPVPLVLAVVPSVRGGTAVHYAADCELIRSKEATKGGAGAAAMAAVQTVLQHDALTSIGEQHTAGAACSGFVPPPHNQSGWYPSDRIRAGWGFGWGCFQQQQQQRCCGVPVSQTDTRGECCPPQPAPLAVTAATGRAVGPQQPPILAAALLQSPGRCAPTHYLFCLSSVCCCCSLPVCPFPLLLLLLQPCMMMCQQLRTPRSKSSSSQR